ncbi:MAG: hypothetical protein AAF492_05970, partial [Verrucomicrobiota bacterium]
NAQGAGSLFILSGEISGTNTSILMFRGANGLGILSNNLFAPNATFTKTDNGRWIIASPTNRFAALQLSVGTLDVTLDDALPTNIVVSIGQNGNSALLDLHGTRQTISGLRLSAGTPANQRVGNSSATNEAHLTINSPGSNTFAGIIEDALGLTLDGGHHLNLTGNNTYTEPTLISNATLLVAGAVAGVVTAFNGAVYGGGGSCGDLTLEAGATHRPGFDGPGTDTVNGNYDLRGTLAVEIDGAVDRVNVSGLLQLGAGSTLMLSEQTPGNKAIFTVAEYSARAGTFGLTNGLPAGYRLIYDFGPMSNRLVLLREAFFLWDGEAAGNTWAADTNWIADMAPPSVTTNRIYFDILGTATGDQQTSHLDQDRVIGGLNLASDLDFFHTIDLTGFALNVHGDMVMTESDRDTFITITNSLTNGGLSVTNGGIQVGINGSSNTLRISSPFSLFTTNHNIDLARRIGPVSSNITATLDFSGSSNVRITAERILMAHATSENGGIVRGILHFSQSGSNTISVTNMTVGDSPLQGNADPPSSEIHFGSGENILYADTVQLGLRKCDATLDTGPGGSLLLRGRNKTPMTLRVGFNLANTATLGDGLFDTSGSLLDARFDQLELGRHNTGNGGGRGTFTMGNGFAVASNVTLAVTGGANPANTRGIINIDGGAFHVADSVSDGAGAGNINVINGLMVVTNHLMVDTLLVGGNGNNNATVLVRQRATIGTGSENLRVARNANDGTTTRGLLDLRTASNVTINVAALQIGTGNYQSYGTVMLATNGVNDITATTVSMGDVNPSGNQADWNHLVAGGATLINATTINIGHRKSRSEISLHTNATLTIGGPSNRVANLRLGFNNVNTGTRGFGLLNGSNGALNVYADTVVLGRHDGTSLTGGFGDGTLIMDSSNDVFDAVTVTLGHTDGDADATAAGH